MSARKPSKKSIEEKRKLITLSCQAKKYREKLIGEAKSPEQALIAAGLKINDILMMFYTEETSQHEFRTFKEWKEMGMAVKAGESSFRIWGKPKKGQKTIESDSGENFENEYSFFPMVCLFHAGQVEIIEQKSAS